MHAEIKLKIENGELKMKEFYGRLYPKYKLFKTTKEFLKHIACNIQHATPTKDKPNENTETFIIGSKPDIISPRNFVCLDTRSREIRNKTVTSKE